MGVKKKNILKQLQTLVEEEHLVEIKQNISDIIHENKEKVFRFHKTNYNLF